jgi:hypothetical protein
MKPTQALHEAGQSLWLDFDLAEAPRPLSVLVVGGDPVVGDLGQRLAIGTADLDGRAVRLQTGHRHERMGPRVGPDQVGGLRRNHPGCTVEADLAAPERGAGAAVREFHRPGRAILARAVAQGDSVSGQAQLGSVEVDGPKMATGTLYRGRSLDQSVQIRQAQFVWGDQLSFEFWRHEAPSRVGPLCRRTISALPAGISDAELAERAVV